MSTSTSPLSYRQFILRVLTVVFIIVLAVTAWQLREIILLCFLSTIIAVSLSIPAEYMERMGLSHTAAIASTIIGVLLVLFFLFFWILPIVVNQMADLVSSLPDAAEAALETYEDFRNEKDYLKDALPELSVEKLEDQLKRTNESGEETGYIQVEDVTNFAVPILTGVGNFLVSILANILIVIIVAIYLLVDPQDYARGSLMLIPAPYQSRFMEIMGELRNALTAWLAGLTLSISITIVLVWLVLGIFLGIPNAIAIGVIAGIFTIIPNIGSIIPLIPIIIFTLADDPQKIILALPLYFVIQQIESSIITPRIVKKQLNIPAGATLVFQLIAASLFGFLGILMAVPMLAAIITLVKEIYVYDILGLRHVNVEIHEAPDGSLMVSHTRADAEGKAQPRKFKFVPVIEEEV